MSRVNIILSVYNGEKFIAKAIRSVLNQSYKDWELLVINDGSTDSTEEIVKVYSARDPRIQYIKNEKNLGIQKSLNRGLRLAKGNYIARIDDDDEWVDPEKLEKQVVFLEQHRDYVLVGTGVIVVDESGNELFRFLNPQRDEDIRARILSRNCFTHSSVVFRKDAALRVGGYDESPRTLHSEDYDLWLKLGTVGKFANLPLYAIRFMMREDSISAKNKSLQLQRNIEIARKYKDKYPNYGRAYCKNRLKQVGYCIYKLLPFPAVRNFLFKRYKEK